MTNNEFREWLKGFFELSAEDTALNPQQIQVIVNHLNLAEAVEGHLDETNSQLRADIQLFREQAPHEASGFKKITQSTKDLIFK